MTNSEARNFVRQLTNQWASEMIEAVAVGGPIKDEVDVYRVKKAFRNVAIRQAEARAASEARKQSPVEECIPDVDGGFGM